MQLHYEKDQNWCFTHNLALQDPIPDSVYWKWDSDFEDTILDNNEDDSWVDDHNDLTHSDSVSNTEP